MANQFLFLNDDFNLFSFKMRNVEVQPQLQSMYVKEV